MSNSPLVVYSNFSPNCSSRYGNAIRKITPHYVDGNLSLQQLGAIFSKPSRRASSNYGIDSEGRVGMFVPESERSWCSSSAWNDRQAVTIEVANLPDSSITPQAWEALVQLCVDICKRNGIDPLVWDGTTGGSLTVHRMFADTSCPGAYLMANMGRLADEVNARLHPAAPAGPVGPWTPIPCDGWWGRTTSRRLKDIVKAFWWPEYTYDDSILHQWPENRQPACTSGWEYDRTKQGDPAIVAIQALLHLPEDGILGPETIRHLQAALGTPVDGRLDGPSTAVRKLQENMCHGFLWVP